jgi:dienelactone hydrolase
MNRYLLGIVAAATLVAGCGGGGNDVDTSRGSLRESPTPVLLVTAAQIDASTAAAGTQAFIGRARCSVLVVSLNFNTIGVRGEPSNSSGVLLLPAGPCSGTAAPLIVHGHGTEVNKDRTLAKYDDVETSGLMAVFAAQGYAVVAPDYLGYAKSEHAFHPYLHAETEASTMVDAIRAARLAASVRGATLTPKVYVTGYSQGAHTSMSTHRSIERDLASEFQIAAAAHLAGPYNVSTGFNLPTATSGNQFFASMMVTNYQKIYGDVYTDVNAAFRSPYASYIETLLPSSGTTYVNLVSSGKLPGAPNTPVQARDLVFQPGFVTAVTTNANHPLNVNARKNDLFGWNPKAPTLLCQGSRDPIIPYTLQQAAIKADFDSRGVTTVTAVDADPLIQAVYGVGGVAPSDPTSPEFATYYGNYHGSYAVGVCWLQARAFFDANR